MKSSVVDIVLKKYGKEYQSLLKSGKSPEEALEIIRAKYFAKSGKWPKAGNWFGGYPSSTPYKLPE
jgi:hypothetical protein